MHSKFRGIRFSAGAAKPHSAAQIAFADELRERGFFRFLEILCDGQELPSARDQLLMTGRFSFIVTLAFGVTRLDLAEYRKRSTEEFWLANVRLPFGQVRCHSRIRGRRFTREKGAHWETNIGRIGIRGSVEGRKKIADWRVLSIFGTLCALDSEPVKCASAETF